MMQVEKITELLILVSDFTVNCTLKTLKAISVKCMKCLKKGANKKNKRTDPVHCQWGRLNHYQCQVAWYHTLVLWIQC